MAYGTHFLRQLETHTGPQMVQGLAQGMSLIFKKKKRKEVLTREDHSPP